MNRRKNILITGGNFTNQGAYLMLWACSEAIRELGAQPLISVQTGSEREKRWMGLDSLAWVPRLRLLAMGRTSKRSSTLRSRLPVALGSDVDAVFDISGFVFSDQWQHLNLERRVHDLNMWSERGVPVYLLPQAFGPFEHTSRFARGVVNHGRLTFARDQDSLDYLKGVDGIAADRIRLGVDFTVGVEPERVAGIEHLEHGAAIVPNWNIISRAAVTERAQYLDTLEEWIRAFEAKGTPAFLLCHEGERDEEIANAAVQRRNLPCTIVSGLNGRQSKYVLSRCRFVVSGRFHALVSALSSGVPSVSHGWSHKYVHLAQEFSVSELVSDPFGGAAEVGPLIETLYGNEALFRKRCTEESDRLKVETRQMWAAIGEDLDSVLS